VSISGETFSVKKSKNANVRPTKLWIAIKILFYIRPLSSFFTLKLRPKLIHKIDPSAPLARPWTAPRSAFCGRHCPETTTTAFENFFQEPIFFSLFFFPSE
jgi:hypothetical protein